MDSNHRSQRRQIYSLFPLATRDPSHKIKLWSWWTESNHQPADYKSAALPVELHQQLYLVPRGGIEPPTQGFSVPCSTDWATEPNKKWRFRPGSNRRSSAWQADVITTTLRNQNGCGRWIWTNDLWVMSPTSYQTAPSRDIINGGERGIRTPAPSPTSRFSRPVPSTRLGYFSKYSFFNAFFFKGQIDYNIVILDMSINFMLKNYFFSFIFNKKTPNGVFFINGA